MGPMVLTEQATSFADTSSKKWIGILKRPLMNSKYTVGILLNVKTTLMISKKENGLLQKNNQNPSGSQFDQNYRYSSHQFSNDSRERYQWTDRRPRAYLNRDSRWGNNDRNWPAQQNDDYYYNSRSYRHQRPEPWSNRNQQHRRYNDYQPYQRDEFRRN